MRLFAAPTRLALVTAGLGLLAACATANQSVPSQVFPAGQAAGNASAMERSVTVSPDKCKTTGHVKLIPCVLAFKKPNQQKSVTLSGVNLVMSTEKDNCTQIASFVYFNYGIWYVTSGSKAGKCTAVFTGYDKNHKVLGSATLSVTSKA